MYAVARATSGFSSSTLLLAGVAVSFLFTSVILAIQYIGDVTTSFRIGRWLLGGLEVVGFLPVIHVLPFAVVGIAILFAISRDLDLLVLGEESAASRGVSVTTVKKLIFAAASLMVGGVVATCGPIGFVGLVVPHVGRTHPRAETSHARTVFGAGGRHVPGRVRRGRPHGRRTGRDSGRHHHRAHRRTVFPRHARSGTHATAIGRSKHEHRDTDRRHRHTSLVGGRRISKGDARVDAYGTVDELIAQIGLARALSGHAEAASIAKALQRDLFAVAEALASDDDPPKAWTRRE